MNSKMPDQPDNLPGNGFLGWLGRQVGHITKAVKTDVAPPPADASKPDASTLDASKIVYRECTIEEKESPLDPNIKLRRTIIDEVVEKGKVDSNQMQRNKPQMNTDQHR